MSKRIMPTFQLPTAAYSDGNGDTCQRPNAVQNDQYMRDRLGTAMQHDAAFVKAIPIPAGHNILAPALPAGYSCWETLRASSNQKDRFTYGHPNGRFNSFPLFWEHFKYMHLNGTTEGCGCVKCSPMARDSSTPTAPPASAPLQTPSTQTPAQSTQQFAPPQPLDQNPKGFDPPLFSDGTGTRFNDRNFLPADDLWCRQIGAYLEEQGLFQDEGSHILSYLPAGYSGYQVYRAGERAEILVTGHPSDLLFSTVPDFVDHLEGLRARQGREEDPMCQCVLCTGTPRSPMEGAIRVPYFMTAKEVAVRRVQQHGVGEQGGQEQGGKEHEQEIREPEPEDDVHRAMFCNACLTVHSVAQGCDQLDSDMTAEEEAEAARELGLSDAMQED